MQVGRTVLGAVAVAVGVVVVLSHSGLAAAKRTGGTGFNSSAAEIAHLKADEFSAGAIARRRLAFVTFMKGTLTKSLISAKLEGTFPHDKNS